MLTTFIEKLRRTSAAPSDDERALLAQITGENPADLRRQLAQLEARRGANLARWTALGPPRDQGAARERRAIEDQGPELDAQIKVMDARIARAEARHAAVLELTRLLDETDETIAALTAELFARVLVADETERRTRLVAIDGYVRLRSRVAAALAPVAPSVRRFRRGAPDPFGTLRSDLLERVQELDRLHAPGMPRAPIQWPAGALELLDAVGKGGSA
jgi:transposase